MLLLLLLLFSSRSVATERIQEPRVGHTSHAYGDVQLSSAPRSAALQGHPTVSPPLAGCRPAHKPESTPPLVSFRADCVENPDNFPLLACENSRLALGGFRPPPPSRETKSARCEAAVFAGYSSSFCGFADKLGKGLLSMRSWAIMKSGPETVTRQWVIHGFRELVINDRRKES